MQIPVQQYPILTPGQMNPFHQALASGLDSYQNIVKSAYMPSQLKAEIASKAAYATYSPYSYLSKALSDPMILSALSKNPEQLNAILGKFATMPTDPYASVNGSSETPDNSSGSWWNRGGGNKTQPQAFSPPSSSTVIPGQQGNPIPGTGPDEGTDYDANGNNIVATPDEINNGSKAQPVSSPSTNAPASNVPSETSSLVDAVIGSKLPLSPQGIRLSTEKAGSEQNARNEENLWQDKIKENSKRVVQNQGAINAVKNMQTVYSKLDPWEKGYFGGMTPAVSSNAQKFDNYAQNLSTANARAVQTGHITNADFQIFNRMKVNRRMNDDAFKDLSNYHQSLSLRDKQAQQFYNKAKELHDKGKLTYSQADQIWSTFIEEYPLFDPSTGELIKKNVKMSPFSLGKESRQYQQKSSSDNNFASEFLKNTFKSKEEFKQSFYTLNEDVQKEVIRLMKEGGMH